MLYAVMGPNIILKTKNIIIRRLKSEKKFQHTIFMRFSRSFAIIIYYTVQFNLECFKCSVPDMGPNTILIFKIKRRLKSEI